MSYCFSLSRMVHQIISTWIVRTWRLLKRIKSLRGCDSVDSTFGDVTPWTVPSYDMSRIFYTTVYDVTTQLPPWEFQVWRRLLRCRGTIVIHFHNTFVSKSTIALYGFCRTSSWSTKQRGAPAVTVSVQHYFLKKSTKYKAVKPRWSPSSESLLSRKLSKAEEWPCLCGTSLLLEEASKEVSLQNLRLSIF